MPGGESDCAAALENILLVAHSLNIGSCWIHTLTTIEDNPKAISILTELGIPEYYAVFATVVLGFNG